MIYYHHLTNLTKAPGNSKSGKISDPRQVLNHNLLNMLPSIEISVQYLAASTYPPLVKNTSASLLFLTQSEQHYLKYVIEMG